MLQPTRTLLSLALALSCVSAWAQMPPAPLPANANPLLFELMQRLDQVEDEARQLRGELELSRYQNEELVRRIEALEQQMQGLKTNATANPPAADSASTTNTAPAVDNNAEEASQLAYDRAITLLRDGQYGPAISAFKELIAQYPTSATAPNAYYWLGEAYYVNRDYEHAKQTYIKFGSQFPQHERVPDAMLKLGATYQQLGDKARAREVLQRIRQSYPSSNAATQAVERLKQLQ